MGTVADHGIALADRFDAAVHALHVVDDRAYAPLPEDAQIRVQETLEADAEAATKAIAERALESDLHATREIRWGNPPAGIIAYATEHDIDLIIMGTHGRTGYDRYLLGSVAEKVVRAAPVPVLTINIGEQPTVSEDVSSITVPDSVPQE